MASIRCKCRLPVYQQSALFYREESVTLLHLPEWQVGKVYYSYSRFAQKGSYHSQLFALFCNRFSVFDAQEFEIARS